LGGLAVTFWIERRWKEAEELEVQVMETRKRVSGHEHPDPLTGIGTWQLHTRIKDDGRRWKSYLCK
jgi:hypothetical protein